ncbi:MAG TPA: DUF4190 domain-containing protein [Isosphaeraceae bacterium]|jgi:hypothetical protein|nr:DUF4190 domain-containing protein [Isosphaeraceae bacterium]
MSQGYYDQGEAGYGAQPVPQGNPSAVVSLVCGILGCIPLVTGLLAVIFGIVGLNKARDPYVSGKGMSIAGLVLGVISLIGWGGFGAIVYVGWDAFGKPTKAAIEFAQELSRGDVDAAMARTTGIARDKLVADSDAIKASGPITSLGPQSFNKTAVQGQPETLKMSGITVRQDGKNGTFTMTLTRVGDDYKISDYSFK